jgi:hypothetical protein
MTPLASAHAQRFMVIVSVLPGVELTPCSWLFGSDLVRIGL